MSDPILDFGTPGDIELNGQNPDDVQITENQEEDLLIELDGHADVVLADGEEDDLILEDSYPGAIPYNYYHGPYAVTPILHDDQNLETNQKILTDDVTVKPIPVTITTNPYGGKTVVIG